MATVTIQKRKRKNGISYLVSYRVPLTGKKKHFKTFSKLRYAQTSANELRSLLDLGKLPETKKTRLNPLRFNEVTDSLVDEWDLRRKKGELAKKTVDEYFINLKVLNNTFGEKILCQISNDEIVDYVKEIMIRNSNVSANKYLSMFRKVFSHGSKLNAVVYDPTEDMKFLSEKKHIRNRFLLPHELDRLIRATGKVKAKYYMPAIIYLGAEHGASKQEILSLKWSNVDFEFSGIGLVNFFRTKNQRERTEFLMPRTREALLNWQEHLNFMRHRKKIVEIGSDFIFCHLNGQPLKNFKSAWKKILTTAGIENFHFHDLRHTFCSNLILSGASLKDVKEMIGHSDISMTDRYSHLTLKHLQAKQQNLAKYYTDEN